MISMIITYLLAIPLAKEILLRYYFKDKKLQEERSIMNKRTLIVIKRFGIFMLIGSLSIGSVSFINEYLKVPHDKIQFYLVIFATCISIPYLLAHKYVDYTDKQYFLRKIKSMRYEREYIYTVYYNLKGSKYLSSFIFYLDENVEPVYGKWPEEAFLNNNSNVSISFAILDKRWREAEEQRKAEAEQTKRQTAPRVSASKTAKDFVGEGKLAAALEQALAQPPLSTDSRNSLIQFQSRLSKLEAEKQGGFLESAAYEARYNTLVRGFLESGLTEF